MTSALSSIRGLLIAEQSSAWQALFSRFTEQGIRIDMFDSATAGLGMLTQAAAAGTPYGIVLLGRQVQGLDATILATAIKGDAGGKDALLAFLSERTDEDASALVQAGFSALIHIQATPEAAAAALVQLWQASACGHLSSFISSSTLHREIAVRMVEKPCCEDELEALQEMFGTTFAELAALYQKDSPPRIASLHSANANSDCAMVAKVAHALSGSSASIGATGLSVLCKALEKQAESGALEGFAIRMAEIEAEYRRITGKLQSMLTREQARPR